MPNVRVRVSDHDVVVTGRSAVGLALGRVREEYGLEVPARVVGAAEDRASHHTLVDVEVGYAVREEGCGEDGKDADRYECEGASCAWDGEGSECFDGSQSSIECEEGWDDVGGG